MSIKGIIMFLGINNTRFERKILIILDFENGFLLTYLPLCHVTVATTAAPTWPAAADRKPTLFFITEMGLTFKPYQLPDNQKVK